MIVCSIIIWSYLRNNQKIREIRTYTEEEGTQCISVYMQMMDDGDTLDVDLINLEAPVLEKSAYLI